MHGCAGPAARVEPASIAPSAACGRIVNRFTNPQAVDIRLISMWSSFFLTGPKCGVVLSPLPHNIGVVRPS